MENSVVNQSGQYGSPMKRANIDQDPDYVDTAAPDLKRLKTLEQAARADTSTRIKKIILEHFDKEIENCKNVASEIDARINRVKQELHFLRYAAASAYYSNKNLKAEIDQPQHPIHPAVREHLGKRPRSEQLTETTEKQPVKNQTSDEPLSKVPRYIPPNLSVPEVVATPMRAEHYRAKKKIIIGNVSKWIPISDRKDSASHKWMVYVRGPRENPSIGHFVSRVQFYLHPSYAPHDIVDVSAPPFHITRRGWGEFPLRVQILFKNPLDKPVNIIHHLKLDRTYTGLQTLGAETVVDVLVYDSATEERSLAKDQIQLAMNAAEQIKLEENATITHGTSDEELNVTIKEELLDSELNITIKEEILDPIEKSTDSCTSTTLLSSSIAAENIGIKQEPITEHDNQAQSNSSGKCVSIPIANGNSNSTALPTLVPGQPKPQQPLMVLCRTSDGSWVKIPITSLQKAVTIKSSNGGTASLQDVPIAAQVKPVPVTKIIPAALSKLSLVRVPVTSTAVVKRVSVSVPKLPSEGLLNPIIQKIAEEKKRVEAFSAEVVAKDWRCVRDCVRFLAQYFKLIDPRAADPQFRCVRPYCATSAEAFSSWNIGKQRSAEWSRAKDIRQLLSRCKFASNETVWTTKKIFTWTRRRGYSPQVVETSTESSTAEEKRNFQDINSFSEVEVPETAAANNVEEAVDIESEEPASGLAKKLEDRSQLGSSLDELETDLTDWVSHSVAQLGFRLGPDSLEGENFNVSRVLLSGVWKIFAEDLLRRSLREAWHNSDGKQPASVEIEDTVHALLRRQEFSLLTNEGLGIKKQDS